MASGSPRHSLGDGTARQPGDEYLVGALVVQIGCMVCARPTRQRKVYDPIWGQVNVVCLDCGHVEQYTRL